MSNMSAIKFLVIDDTTLSRTNIKKALQHNFVGSTVEHLGDAKKARSYLKNNRFDMVLCEWELPDMSGMELLRWMRGEPNYRDMPFVMLSSQEGNVYAEQALNAGANGFLEKPFTPDAIEKLVAKILEAEGKLDRAKRLAKRKGAFDSAGALGAVAVSSSEKAAAPAKPASRPAVTKAPEKQKTQKVTKGQARLLFSDCDEQCLLRDIDLNIMNGVIKNTENLPRILEPVSVIILQADGKEVTSLSGFVMSLEAAEKKIDSDFIKVDVRFAENEPNKIEGLSSYLRSL